MPKRIGNLFQTICDRNIISTAFRNGIKHKKTHPTVRELWTDEALKTWIPGTPAPENALDEQKVSDMLAGIRDDLLNSTYEHGKPRHKHQYCTSKAKGTKGGKWREIYCPALRDHVFQHALFLASEKAFMRGMYRFCVGNVPGRGTGEAVKYVTKWCRNDTEWKYFVKLDIRKFFDSIRIEDIRSALARRIKDPRILTLHDQVLRSAPVPCPVGYFLSPWYGNLVLEPLDHHIAQDYTKTRRGKQINLVRHYIRYADDMLIMGSSKRDLKSVVQGVARWLAENLALELKPEWEIKRIAEYMPDGRIRKGTYRVDYIGYRFDRTRTILRDRCYLSAKRLAHRMRRKKHRGCLTVGDAQSLVSKCGMAASCNAGSLYREINQQIKLKTCREMISDDAKCRVRQPASSV